jgi:SAM-dependent methyltransferase
MQTYGPSTYGESIAEHYDAWYPDPEPQMVERLVELSAGGKALELGIGTGRVALPLQARGIEVHGIDSSPAMVDRLRAKPGGQRIPVTLGSFAEFEMEERFHLVFVVFSTLFGLLTQQEQLSCFRSVAKVLVDGGSFVVEAFLPDLGRFDRGQSVRAADIDEDHVRIECSQHEPLTQTVTTRVE